MCQLARCTHLALELLLHGSYGIIDCVAAERGVFEEGIICPAQWHLYVRAMSGVVKHVRAMFGVVKHVRAMFSVVKHVRAMFGVVKPLHAGMACAGCCTVC